MPRLIRKDLVAALTELRHTVAVVDDFPILACVHFGPAGLSTYDGSVALRVPYAVDGLAGCVSFAKLLAWIKKIKGKEIEATLDGSWATFVCGSSASSKVRLGMLGPWPLNRWPHFVDAPPVSADWYYALCLADRCRGVDIDAPWRLGVTMVAGSISTKFYASDNVALAIGDAPASPGQSSAVVQLPVRLLDVLAGLKEAPTTFAFDDRWLQATYADGRTVICLQNAGKPNISRFLDVNPDDEWSEPFVKLDGEFAAAVARTCDVHRDEERVRLTVTVGGGGLRLDATGDGAETNECMQVETQHHTQEVCVDARVLKSATQGATGLRAVDRMLLLKYEHGAVITSTLG